MNPVVALVATTGFILALLLSAPASDVEVAPATAPAAAAVEPERLSALIQIGPAAKEAPAEEAPPAVEAPTPQPVLAIETTGTMPFSPTLEPPHFDDVLRIVDPAAGYTTGAGSKTYLLGHSRTPWRGWSPANDWHALKEGDVATVDGKTMRVAERFVVAKTAIAGVPGLWEHAAGWVVAITCVPKLSGEVADQNLVVIFEPVGDGGCNRLQ
ncbi:hypothetical protein [Microbacterium sp. MC2]